MVKECGGKKETNGFLFHDADKDPDTRPEGPKLLHFRSSSMKMIAERQDTAWRKVLATKTSLPTVFIRLFDDSGMCTGRHYFHGFSSQPQCSREPQPHQPQCSREPHPQPQCSREPQPHQPQCSREPQPHQPQCSREPHPQPQCSREPQTQPQSFAELHSGEPESQPLISTQKT